MTPLNWEQQRRVEENLALVPWAIQRFYGITCGHRDFDDLVALGEIGLMRAAVSYEPEKGEFSTWATWKIRGAVWSHIRAAGRSRAVCVGDVDPDRDVRGTCERSRDHEAIRRRLAVMLASLTPRQRRVIELRFREGWTYREIGAVLGVTNRRICQMVHDTLALLREQWPEAVRLLEAA